MITEMLDCDYPYGDREGLFTVMNASAQIGLFLSARKAIRDLETLGESELYDKAYIGIPTTLAAAEYLEEHGVDEREVAKRIQVAAETVKKYSRIRHFKVVANSFGIMLEYVVDADMDTLVDIDFAITDALCATFEDPLSNHVSLGVTPPAESV
ncbi:hypothetical protein SAMN04244579_02412 [Azotobacter beijerinckii]|uniref:Uncharacterized protein n=2 Tax=Azotobacter beijerinckii TaxID=170623 RepID=A0A1H6UEV7_9GAMM|nr:hypothetical protein SAMN04244579_02412 [Azotobacter beijerinckii]